MSEDAKILKMVTPNLRIYFINKSEYFKRIAPKPVDLLKSAGAQFKDGDT